MAIGCGGKDTQSSGPSPGALFRRAIKFGSDIGRPVPVVDNDDSDDITDLQAQTPPRLPSLNDTAILNFQFDPTQPVSSNVCNSMIEGLQNVQCAMVDTGCSPQSVFTVILERCLTQSRPANATYIGAFGSKRLHSNVIGKLKMSTVDKGYRRRLTSTRNPPCVTASWGEIDQNKELYITQQHKTKP